MVVAVIRVLDIADALLGSLGTSLGLLFSSLSRILWSGSKLTIDLSIHLVKDLTKGREYGPWWSGCGSKRDAYTGLIEVAGPFLARTLGLTASTQLIVSLSVPQAGCRRFWCM
jgi:hypothetical protein